MKVASIFLVLLSFNLWAKDGQILKCLGEEEKRFHLKKETGPVYDLNQRLIGEMLQIPNLKLNQEDFLSICSGQKFSESWKLLELSIKRGKSLFIVPKDLPEMKRAMSEGMIEDYVEQTREILIAFISQIQAQSPTATCLKQEIPELDQFFVEIKYLQEDVDMKEIFKNRDQRIFEKLKNYPLAFEKCRKRLIKKAKSESTSTPKKR